MKDRSIQLQKEKLLLVEGKDEEFFFEKLLQKHNIQEIQVIAVYGKQRFRKYFPELKKISGFNKKVSSLAVIHDEVILGKAKKRPDFSARPSFISALKTFQKRAAYSFFASANSIKPASHE